MKIDLSELRAQTFSFERPAVGGGGGEVHLSQVERLSGTYLSDETGSSLQNTRAAGLAVERATWHVGAGVITVGGKARLEEVELGLSIPKGVAKTSLRISVGGADLDRVSYEMRDVSVAGAASLQGALIERDPGGRLAIAGVRLIVRDLCVTAGALVLTAKEAVAESASVVVHQGDLRIQAARLSAREVSLQQGDVTVSIGQLEAPSGVAYRNGDVAVEDLMVTLLELTLASVGGKGGESTARPQAAQRPAGTKPRIPDLSVLDGLSGQIDLDLTVDATIPLLKSRRATHYFRIPVRQGAINFRELERDLSMLEDAVLDFAVKNGELILEKDIPFIPFDNTTLVSWPLVDATDHALAAEKRVRIRRLVDYRVPPPKKKKKADDSGGLALRELDFGNLDANLRLEGTAALDLGGFTLHLGNAEAPAIESVAIRGNLRHLANGPPHPGHVDVKARGIALAVAGLSVAKQKLDCRALHIGEAESVRIDFAALRPTKVSAKIAQARVQGLSLARPVV